MTETFSMKGSGKGPESWITLTEASVYFDHPVHLGDDHALNIDFRNPALGPAARVAVELRRETALQLARSIIAALDSAPA